jgi:glycine/D-amino acid oxidase-like deaminating enzyme/nitrite reductase/ring-hydroxylating ferredoxin subunit
LGSVNEMPKSYWLDLEHEAFPPLSGRARADVVVIGAGITGLTTAVLLQRSGLSVTLIERHKIASRTTGNTTAKVTILHGLTYADLAGRSEESARKYLAANLEGLNVVADLADTMPGRADLSELSAYTYTETGEQAANIEAEVEALQGLGQAVTLTTETGLPYPIAQAVRVDQQFTIHPVKYCLGLADAFLAAGGTIHEHTGAVDVDDGPPCVVSTESGHLEADWVVLATLIPFLNDGWYSAKAEPSRSYALLAHVAEAGADIGGMYLSADPITRTLRPTSTAEGTALIIGGEGHRTGEVTDTLARYDALEQWANERFPVEHISHRWSAQDYLPVDGVPFVGPLGNRTRTLVATGFKKWGLTNGTAAAVALHGAITGAALEWADVYDASRSAITKGPKEFAKHSLTTARHLVGDRLRRRPDIEDLTAGAGAVVDTHHGKAAIWRDDNGELHAVSPVCTHLGCLVQWNNAERSWDCPCHGSRFDCDGTVLDGPAVMPLEPIEMRDEPTER